MGGTRVTHWHFDDFLFSFILFCSTKLRHLSLHGTQNGRYSDIGNRKKRSSGNLQRFNEKMAAKHVDMCWRSISTIFAANASPDFMNYRP
jgi:hypothetical protein